MQTVTIKKKFVIRHIVFLLILATGLGTVIMSQGIRPKTIDVRLYFVDAEMLRLIPVTTTMSQTTPQKMAQHVLDELIEGRDDNPKIRRIMPKEKNGMKVVVKNKIAHVNISSKFVEEHPEGRDLELLTVYSIVNSLTGIDGIVNVRFSIDGKIQKDFKGNIDMRETFIPDYFI